MFMISSKKEKKKYVVPEMTLHKVEHQGSLLTYSDGFINMRDEEKTYYV